MRRPLIFACCFVLAGLAAQAASAAMINGQFVPDGLVGNVGAEYRLIFVTAGATRGDQITKTFYDTFVQGEADLSPLFAGKNSLYKWQAVVTVGTSVPLYDARTVLAGTAPVYNLQSDVVGENGTDMLDGSLDHSVQYDQYTNDAGLTEVWTGGLAPPGPLYPSTSYWLGTPGAEPPPGETSPVSRSYLGLAFASDASWLVGFPAQQFITPGVPFGAAVYGISGVLTVPVPEPSTLVLWSLFTGVAGLVFWRKRRQSN
jgi:hypothetical protein